MSEILRAVLDESCKASQPIFYIIPFQMSATVASAVTRQDRYFLMTSMALGFHNLTPTASLPPYLAFNVTDPQTGESMVSTQPVGVAPQDMAPFPLLNWKLNSAFTMPEYKLWRPASRMVVQISAPVNTTYDLHIAVLSGIEYAR